MGYTFAAAATDNIDAGTAITHGTNYSLAVRFTITAANTTTRHLVALQRASDAHQNAYLTFAVGTNQVYAGHTSFTGGQTYAGTNWVSGFTAGSTHVLVLTYDSTDPTSHRLYADTDSTPKATSVSQTAALGWAPDTESDQRMVIGNRPGESNSADALIHEVAWFPNTVLSGVNAAALGAGGPLAVGFPLPAHYWNFTDDATDLYGGADGTVTGATHADQVGTAWFPTLGTWSTPPELWFQSNLRVTDLVPMFTTGRAGWATSRRKITAFKFFDDNLFTGAIPTTGQFDATPNTIAALVAADAFRKLATDGITIAAECTAINWPGQPTDIHITKALTMLGNVAAAGARLTRLEFDWSRYRGMTSLGLSQADTITAVKAFTDAILADYPDVLFGDIEGPYYYTAAEMTDYWDACIAAGVPLAWVTLDVIWTDATGLARAQTAATTMTAHGVPVHLIVDPGLSPNVVGGDAQYYTASYSAAQTIQSSFLDIPNLTLESWYDLGSINPPATRTVPTNLSETTANTHTKLLKDVAALFSVPDTVAPSNDLLLMLSGAERGGD